MNKCIMQNWKIFNKIRFEPMGLELEFEQPKDSQIWSENQWNHIVNDELERHAIYTKKTKENKYTITLWSDEEYIYLIQVLRTEYKSNDTLVYMAKNTPDNLNDFKAIAKFIHLNINEIINGSKKNAQEFAKIAAMIDAKNKTEIADGEA